MYLEEAAALAGEGLEGGDVDEDGAVDVAEAVAAQVQVPQARQLEEDARGKV